MSTPYGGGNPQQWGQQPQHQFGPAGSPPGGSPGSGGFPAQGGYPPQPGHGAPPNQPYPGPAGAYPPSGPQQQLGQFQFGQPGGMSEPPAKKSNKGLLIGIIAVVVLILAALGVTGFWQPGFLVSKVFDQATQQNEVKKVLVEKYNVPSVDSVSCPSDQEVKANSTFECTAKIGGQDRKVTITVKDDEGTYQVSEPK